MTSVEKWLSAHRRSEGGGDIGDIGDKSTNPGLLGGDKLATSWRHFGSRVEHTPTTQPGAQFVATLSPPGGDKRHQQYQSIAANVANVANVANPLSSENLGAPTAGYPSGDWRDLLEERAAIREFDGHYTRAEAAVLAWGELQNRWHLELGDRVPRDLCAGCHRPIGAAEALDLIDGNRVHFADNDVCLIRHGNRWRANATRALLAVGPRPPSSGR